MEIKGKLKSDDLRRIADEVRQYGIDFQAKIQTFLKRLADKGILVAEESGGAFGHLITFTKETETDGVVIIGRDAAPVYSSWLKKDGSKVTAKLSPLLMSEFGAGPHAIIWEGVINNTDTLPDGTKIGRGTLPPYEDYPGQTHAFESQWRYKDLSGNWHTADGYKPKRPMHNAMVEIINAVNATAREVFGNGNE